MDKLVHDPELMLQGFNTHGSFYTTQAYTVMTESDFIFDKALNVNNMNWNPLTPTQITINEEGIYKLLFLTNIDKATQVTIFVNNIPLNYTTQGINKGSTQLTIWTILNLQKNDVVTVKNHTSNTESINTVANAGGKYSSLSAILQIFKICSNVKSPAVHCYTHKYYMNCYNKFRNY